MGGFFVFLVFVVFTVTAIFLCIAGIFFILRLGTAVFDKFAFGKLKRMIVRNPRLGQEDGQGRLAVKRGAFTVTYRLNDQGRVTFVSLKRRLWDYERAQGNLKRTTRDFWLYREWAYLFAPRFFFPAALAVVILYVVVLEPFGSKVDRLRWVISGVVGLPIHGISFEPGGWVVIAGHRKTAAGDTTESFSYYVRPLKWLVSSDGGFIVRDRGDNSGPVTYPVRYEKGKIEVKKEGSWVTGTVHGKTVDWEGPHGPGPLNDNIVIPNK